MNIRILDLNLLTVFDAIMRERNVSKAGQRLGLSQSAVSHTLNRLRHVLKDDLFVRTTQGMVPTPAAEWIAEPISQALADLRLALEPQAFVPSEAKRRFAVAIDSFAELVLAPRLVAAVLEAAPSIELDLRPLEATSDLAGSLDNGDVDLALGALTGFGERFSHEPLADDRLVAVMRCDHPASRGNSERLPLSALADMPYLEISFSCIGQAVRRWFADRGLSYKVAHRAPLLAAVGILARTDMVNIGLGLAAQECIQWSGLLTVRELPHDSFVVRQSMIWHRRFDNEAGHRWLRALVAAVSQKALGGSCASGKNTRRRDRRFAA